MSLLTGKYFRYLCMIMKKPRTLYHILLAILSAVLLSIPFYEGFPGMLMLIALLPLLYIERTISDDESARSGSVVWYAIITFSLFTLFTSYWVRYAAWIGIIAAIIVNTSLMSFTFWLFHVTKKRLGNRLGYVSLVVFWLAFEFLYLNGKL